MKLGLYCFSLAPSKRAQSKLHFHRPFFPIVNDAESMPNYLFIDAGRDSLEKSGLARLLVFNKHSLTEPLTFRIMKPWFL